MNHSSPIEPRMTQPDPVAEKLAPQATAVRLLRIMLFIYLLFSLLGLAAVRFRFGIMPVWSSLWSMLPTTLVWVWLMLPRLERRLGRAYLPIGLGLVIVAQTLEYALSFMSSDWVLLDPSLAPPVSPEVALSSGRVVEPLLLLVVSTAIGTWMYGKRGLWATAGLACGLLTAIDVTSLLLGIAPRALIPVAPLRNVLILVVSYIVLTLAEHDRLQTGALSRANAQLREQASALSQANAGLREQASVVEQLATARERNRLARDLHDTLAHSLAALIVQLDVINTLLRSEPEAAQAELITARAAAHEGLQEARQAIRDLRVSPFEDLGLARALERTARDFSERTGLQVEWQISDPAAALPDEKAAQIWRIAQEALNNVERHAGARHVSIGLTHDRSQLIMRVSDDGRGFDSTTVNADRFGLTGIRERAAMIGGQLDVDSAIGRGTTVQLRLTIGA
jgi:signal transduction histidine kinase